MTLSLDEFLRRFLLHLLPKGFVRIRHFGFLASRRRAQVLPLCLEVLDSATGQTETATSTGVRTVGRVQIFLTALKIATIIAILVLGVMANNPTSDRPAFVESPAHGPMVAFLTALVPVMYAYNGFQNLGQLGGEVLSPKKNIPRAVIVGTLVVIVLYVTINWVYFHQLSVSQVAQSLHVASDTVARLLGGSAAKYFTLAMIVSAFGSLHASFLTGPRVP